MPDAPINIDLTKHDDTSLHIARAIAINNYAALEQALCALFSRAAAIDNRAAAIIFFKVVNTRSRMGMLDKLLKHRFPEEPRTYFKSIDSTLKKIDGLRNQIVHWVASTSIDMDTQSIDLALVHPDFTTVDGDPLDIKTIQAFAKHCILYALAISAYAAKLGGAELPPPWPEILQRPLSYPLQSDHPLAQI